MKNLITQLSIAIFLFSSASAQKVVGVYKTYEDFKNGNLLKADDGKLNASNGGGWTAWTYTFKNKGQKMKFKVDEIWGIYDDGNLARFAEMAGKLQPVALSMVGDYCFYEYSEWLTPFSGVGSGQMHVYFVSKDVGSAMFMVQFKKDIKNLAQADHAWDGLYKCVEAEKETGIRSIATCFQNSPNQKKVSDVIPPIKN